MIKIKNQLSGVLGLLLLFSVTVTNQAQKIGENPGIKVKIVTSKGSIIVNLYNATPLHQANFVKLVNEKYYEGTLFHRVIKDFMIQAGDPLSKTAAPGQALGNGGPDYTINPEFNPALIHKKGALAAARSGDDVNPEKKSSGSQFYIVQGKIQHEEELAQIEKQRSFNQIIPLLRDYIQKPENSAVLENIKKKQDANDGAGLDSLVNSLASLIRKSHPEIKDIKYSDQQRTIYKAIGGTPFLDMNYTVFGEVLEGLDIIDSIAGVETGPDDRPKQDIKIISMEVVK